MVTFIQYIFYLAVLILLAIPLGKYISKAMSGEKVFLTKILAPCERGIYKILHIDPNEDMSWKKYLVSVVAFMVGRTPEYLGKKIEPYEMKWAVNDYLYKIPK